MVFQITLTVIGRPEYYAAETHGVEIKIHLVLKSKQQNTFTPPPFAILSQSAQRVNYGALGIFEIQFKWVYRLG